MNSTTCHDIIIDAIRSNDLNKARNYAAILQGWLDDGGSYPDRVSEAAVRSLMHELTRPRCHPAALQREFASLTCFSCDSGQHVASLPQAIDEGWVDLQPDHHEWLTSHLGSCPECELASLSEWLPAE